MKSALQRSLILAIILIGVLFIALTLPKSALAGTCPAPCDQYEEDTPECGACLAAQGGLVKPTEATSEEAVGKLIARIVTWIMGFIGAIAVGFIVYGAIVYVTSAGNEKRVAQAKNIILYAIVGFVIAILAVVIVQIVGREVTGYACSLDPSKGGKGSEWFCMTLEDRNGSKVGDLGDEPEGYECVFTQACTRDSQSVWCCEEGTGSFYRCCHKK